MRFSGGYRIEPGTGPGQGFRASPPSGGAASGGDEFFSSVALLINAENGIVDESNNAHTITAVGDAAVLQDQVKYGSNSLYFDRIGDRLDIPGNATFNYGTGDFTIEMWIRLFNKNGNYVLVEQSASGTLLNTSGDFQFAYSSSLGLRFYSSGFDINEGSSTGWLTDTWYHVSVVRSGTTLSLYKDGVSVASSTLAVQLGHSSTNILIGGNTLNQDLGGWLDDIRITKGVARYTSNFTAPGALPTA